ncbi:hypothetical protein NDU88_004893 [Pleurodeles waltl]|uniref:Uncharacterized protein n=1 Tax=Pleurodeles waltl TaxID=8319 RepID=A0AAV7TSK5_PLEWA|nr:hypothetical protein NDU88_004893 [Pleurodeles waltl]
MAGERTSSKHPGKPSWQLLFSEALRHQRVPPTEEHSLTPSSSMAESTQGATMNRILQEISAVGRKLEGPKRQNDENRPRPAIACLLRHVQNRQLLQAARMHRPFQLDDLEVRLTAYFSKETSERRRAFLDLRPHLHQLDVKYGLFKPARMWITKNGVSKDFYDPKDLQVFPLL